jgi:hypothetical protein
MNSLKVVQNPDGSYELLWNKNDPDWAFLNNLTSDQIQIMIQQAIQMDRNGL